MDRLSWRNDRAVLFRAAVVASPFKSKVRLEAENAMHRHQLIVLRRRLHGRVRVTNHDRWFLIQLYRWFPSILARIRRGSRSDRAARLRTLAPIFQFLFDVGKRPTRGLCLSEIKLAHTDDEVRQEMA
jgi:hypothetical protein